MRSCSYRLAHLAVFNLLVAPVSFSKREGRKLWFTRSFAYLSVLLSIITLLLVLSLLFSFHSGQLHQEQELQKRKKERKKHKQEIKKKRNRRIAAIFLFPAIRTDFHQRVWLSECSCVCVRASRLLFIWSSSRTRPTLSAAFPPGWANLPRLRLSNNHNTRALALSHLSRFRIHQIQSAEKAKFK